MRPCPTLAAATILGGMLAIVPAVAQTPADGRIIRVVYEVILDGQGPRGSTWGFHLAHMPDGRYCVRFGSPGRLTVAIVQKVADVCFDKMPATVDRSQEQRSRSFDAREKGKQITVISYQKGSIVTAGATSRSISPRATGWRAKRRPAASRIAMSCT